MEHIHPENEWYALFVLTGQEEKVKERIMYRFEDRIRVVVPKEYCVNGKAAAGVS